MKAIRVVTKVFAAWLLSAALIAPFSAHAEAPAATPGLQSSQPDESSLTDHRHYINKDGNIVHSPSKTKSGAAPAGATAQCADGTYSFSQHRRGTCSHHGGVSVWLGGM